MEHDDFSDFRLHYSFIPLHKRPQMEVADRAARKSPKLEMNVSFWVGQRDCLARNSRQFALSDQRACIQTGIWSASAQSRGRDGGAGGFKLSCFHSLSVCLHVKVSNDLGPGHLVCSVVDAGDSEA